MTKKLGILKKVDLREIWVDEARDFTPWLSKEKRLELLGETLDLSIELDDNEVRVGRFIADIVAKDAGSDKTIIIENQLNKTNHDHLGKIITYASGLGAEIIIWISEKVTDEHRKAVDWLNENSSEDIAFFALEIELWTIDDSNPAPKFNIVCSPNEWAKQVKETSRYGIMTETKLLQEEFWTNLKEFLDNNHTFLKLRKPRAQHWYSIAVGRSGFNISLTVNTQKNILGTELYIRGKEAKNSFQKLKVDLEKIESEIGSDLEWKENPEGQDCRIILYTKGNIREKEKWNSYFQ